jgi:hypothetical protein
MVDLGPYKGVLACVVPTVVVSVNATPGDEANIYRYRFFAIQQHTHSKFSKTNYLSGRISFTKNSKQSKNRYEVLSIGIDVLLFVIEKFAISVVSR